MNIRMFLGKLSLCALVLVALLGHVSAYTNDEIFQNGTIVSLKSNGASVGRYVRFAGGSDGAWGDLGGTVSTDGGCTLSIESVVKNSDGSYSCRLRSSSGYLFQGMLSIVRIRSTAVNTNQDTQVDFIPAGTDATTGNQLFYIRTYFDKTNTDAWLGALSNKSLADAIPGGSSYAFWDVEPAAFLNDRGGGTLRNHDNQTRSPGKWSNAAFVPDSNGNMVNHGATLWFVEVISLSPAPTPVITPTPEVTPTTVTTPTQEAQTPAPTPEITPTPVVTATPVTTPVQEAQTPAPTPVITPTPVVTPTPVTTPVQEAQTPAPATTPAPVTTPTPVVTPAPVVTMEAKPAVVATPVATTEEAPATTSTTAEIERLAAEKVALEKAKAEAERVAAEKVALEKAKAEAERVAAEKVALEKAKAEAEKLSAEKAAKALEEAKKTLALKGSGETKIVPAGNVGKGVVKEMPRAKPLMPLVPGKQQKGPEKRR